MSEESRKMAKLAVEALEDKKAEDIKVIDISNVSVIADYFIIAGGNNSSQIQALCDNVEEKLGRAGFPARQTEGYEGFYHLMSMSGEVAEAELHYIVRDHDKDLFEAKKKTLKLIEKDMNEKWGEGTVTLTISEQYRNMAEIISTCMHLIDNAKKACENADVTPLVLPIRLSLIHISEPTRRS
mgnify:CR=1 FL=1